MNNQALSVKWLFEFKNHTYNSVWKQIIQAKRIKGARCVSPFQKDVLLQRDLITTETLFRVWIVTL